MSDQLSDATEDQATAATPKSKPDSAELRPGPGFRIRRSADRTPDEIISALSDFETTDISDMLNRMYTMSPDIKNVVNRDQLVGPAITVKVFPGDNLMVHKALDIAQPGDVIVVDAGGHTANAVFGDMVARKARHRGIIGFVIDGLVRDVPELKRIGMPIYSIGTTPLGPLHRGPGEINYSVSCGGIVVNPGDTICADDNGVVVVRSEFAGDILRRLLSQQDALSLYNAAIDRGEFSNAWVDKLLGDADCIIED